MKLRQLLLIGAVFIGGSCALSWQIVWQTYAALAIGSSAKAAALVLVAFTIGLSTGALLVQRCLQRVAGQNAFLLYAFAEVTVAVSGLLLRPAAEAVSALDASLFRWNVAVADVAQPVLCTALFFLPALAMGVTTPLLGRIGKTYSLSTSLLYGINTAGAAIGVAVAAFVILPELGNEKTSYLTAALNLIVALWFMILSRKLGLNPEQLDGQANEADAIPSVDLAAGAYAAVFITGFVTFMLEVAWFRSLRSALFCTSQTLALILCAVLLALGAASLATRRLLARFGVGTIAVAAAILILIVTPLVERADQRFVGFGLPGMSLMDQFIWVFGVIGAPIFMLGVILPHLMDAAARTGQLGRLYALNGIGSAAGSICAAFIFLPWLGFSRTAWFAGLMMLVAGLSWIPRRRWFVPVLVTFAALLFAIHFESGVGRTRVFGANSYGPYEIKEVRETPDSTISAIRFTAAELPNHERTETTALFIDGFAAAAQWGEATSYMAWMGHIPMLLHPLPRQVLVICFGTGQTVNSVRREGPDSVDVVDLNGAVFELAGNFALNEGVLADKRVHPIVMDGRIWLRRSPKVYDVITLEPLPPNFAGTNALYSREFYERAREHLDDNGVIAQWLPAHLVTSAHARSIAKTFLSVFPRAFLWSDSKFGQAVLVGQRSGSEVPFPPPRWPGFERTNIVRGLSDEQVYDNVLLGSTELANYAAAGEIITDDNQLLSYDQPLNLRGSGPRDSVVVLKEFSEAKSKN